MKELILFITATIGLTFIVTKGAVFKPLREWVSLKQAKYPEAKFVRFIDDILSCHKCFSFWGGLFVFVLQYFCIDFLIYAFVGVFFCWMVFDINDLINRK